MDNQRNFDITSYQKANQTMIATNEKAYSTNRSYFSERRYNIKKYSEKEILNIIESGDYLQQVELSRAFFKRHGFYRQTIVFLATLLNYTGVLVPSVAAGQSLTSKNTVKNYRAAMDFINKANLPTLFTEWTLRALRDGVYYGVIQKATKGTFSVIDLPYDYCSSNFKDEQGRDVIEFDLSYFNTIFDETKRQQALNGYPTEIAEAYYDWQENRRKSSYYFIPSDIGICFPFLTGAPLLLNMIPSIMQHEEAVETELVRGKEETKKIIVQEMPHLSDGRLVFEPEEVAEMHAGTVAMMRGDPNVSVLTSYGQVSAITAKSSADNVSSLLEGFLENIYSEAGISKEIFSSSSTAGLTACLNNSTSLMMYFADKMANVISLLLNRLFGNTNLSFKYIILPVTQHNKDNYIKTALSLATTGYSFIVPAVALGINQKDLCDLKDLETQVLKLEDKLKPLATAFTQTSKPANSDSDSEAGRPELGDDEKSEKTVANREALARQ